MKKIICECIPFIVLVSSLIFILHEYIFLSKKLMIVALMAILIMILLKALRLVIRHCDTHSSFVSQKNDIINTYGFILTPINTIPELRNYTFYKYDKLSQIIDRAMDVRVNIYYIWDGNTCDFFLIDQGNLYVYTIKENDKLFSKIDKYFINVQYQR